MEEDDDELIDFPEVHRITGYSREHIRRLETDPKYMGDDPFPGRVSYGFQCRWYRKEVIAWNRRRISRTPLRPPRKSPKREQKLPSDQGA